MTSRRRPERRTAPARPIQYFTDEYLAQCRDMTPEQICQYLDDYRQLTLGSRRARRKLISLRVQEPLLRVFKERAAVLGVPYQTQIHRLMEEWVRRG